MREMAVWRTPSRRLEGRCPMGGCETTRQVAERFSASHVMSEIMKHLHSHPFVDMDPGTMDKLGVAVCLQCRRLVTLEYTTRAHRCREFVVNQIKDMAVLEKGKLGTLLRQSTTGDLRSLHASGRLRILGEDGITQVHVQGPLLTVQVRVVAVCVCVVVVVCVRVRVYLCVCVWTRVCVCEHGCVCV